MREQGSFTWSADMATLADLRRLLGGA